MMLWRVDFVPSPSFSISWMSLRLAVAGGQLGLLLRAGGAVEGSDLLALGERRQLLVFLHAVGVDGAISLVREAIALRGEVLA